MTPTPHDLVLRDDSGLELAATLWDASRPRGMLLVHGLLGTRTMREIHRAAEALAERHDVLAIDVRGHGDSPGRFTWGREEWRQADAGARLLAGAGRSVAAIGFSYGGYHVLRSAARGAPIDRIVTVGAPCDLSVLDHFPFGPKLWRHLPAMMARRRRRLRAEAPPRGATASLSDAELASVRVPVLVVHGEGDWLISSRHAARLASALPRASRVDVPGGFHGEYMVDSHGESLLAAIEEFLGSP